MDLIQTQKSSAKKIKKKKKISQRVATVAGDIVSKKGYVSVIDLFLGIGWLTSDKVVDWKSGKVPYLERVITANLSKISKAMKEFKTWAVHSKLKASFTGYKYKGQKLRFSKTGQLNIETAYSTHYLLIRPEKNKELSLSIDHEGSEPQYTTSPRLGFFNREQLQEQQLEKQHESEFASRCVLM